MPVHELIIIVLCRCVKHLFVTTNPLAIFYGFGGMEEVRKKRVALTRPCIWLTSTTVKKLNAKDNKPNKSSVNLSVPREEYQYLCFCRRGYGRMYKQSTFLGITQLVKAELGAEPCSTEIPCYPQFAGSPCKRKGKNKIVLTFP